MKQTGIPIRVQRRRVKGFKLPENTICVTRGTEFGNPFKVGHHYKWGGMGNDIGRLFVFVEAYEFEEGYTTLLTAKECVEWYEKYIRLTQKEKLIKEKLQGKNLACFCKIGEPCHADVLLEIANQ